MALPRAQRAAAPAHLQARVDLQEEELLGVAVHEELHGAGGAVAARPAEGWAATGGR